MVHGGIIPREGNGVEDADTLESKDSPEIEDQLDQFLRSAHGRGLGDIDEGYVRDGGGWELLYLVSELVHSPINLEGENKQEVLSHIPHLSELLIYPPFFFRTVTTYMHTPDICQTCQLLSFVWVSSQAPPH